MSDSIYPTEVECDFCDNVLEAEEEKSMLQAGWSGGPEDDFTMCAECYDEEKDLDVDRSERTLFLYHEDEEIPARGFHDEEGLIEWLEDLLQDKGLLEFSPSQVYVKTYAGKWSHPDEAPADLYRGQQSAISVLEAGEVEEWFS